MKKIMITIALLSLGTMYGTSTTKVGGNPATWTPLPYIYNFKGTMPQSATVLTNTISVGDGFYITPYDPSTGFTQKVTIYPADAFKTIIVPGQKGIIGSAAADQERHVAQRAECGVTVLLTTTNPNGTTANRLQYIFDITK